MTVALLISKRRKQLILFYITPVNVCFSKKLDLRVNTSNTLSTFFPALINCKRNEVKKVGNHSLVVVCYYNAFLGRKLCVHHF